MRQSKHAKRKKSQPGYSRVNKRLYWVGMVLVFILIAGLFAGVFTVDMQGRGQDFLPAASSDTATMQQPALLFYLADSHVTQRQAGLFLEALSHAGIQGKLSLAPDRQASGLTAVPQSEVTGLAEHLRQNLDSFRQKVDGKPVWLLMLASDAHLAADLPADAFDGLVMIESPAAKGIRIPDWNRFSQDNRPVLLFGSEKDVFYQSALLLFEQITGEDARLFEAAAAAGVHTASQYRSADGQTLLQIYPAYRSHFIHLDYRLAADLAYEMITFYTDANLASGDPVLAYTFAGSQMLSFARRMLLLLAGLLTIPVLLGYALDQLLPGQMAGKPAVGTLSFCTAKASPLRIFLYWLPAALLLVLLYLAANILIDAPSALMTGTLMALPGSFGLISWLAVWLPAQGSQPRMSDDESEPVPEELNNIAVADLAAASSEPPAYDTRQNVRSGMTAAGSGKRLVHDRLTGSSRLTGLLTMLSLILMTILFWFWWIMQFGLPKLSWPGLLLTLVFLLWQLPGVWFSAGVKDGIANRTMNKARQEQAGSRVDIDQTKITGKPVSVAKRLLWLAARQFPWLIVFVFAALYSGTLTAFLIVLMLIWLAWADLAGHIAARTFRRCWPGRLLRSVLLASAWLQPVFIYGLFR